MKTSSSHPFLLLFSSYLFGHGRVELYGHTQLKLALPEHAQIHTLDAHLRANIISTPTCIHTTSTHTPQTDKWDQGPL